MPRNSAEVQQIVRETERPMRWARAQRLSRKHTTAILKTWEQFERKLLAWLPEEITLTDARKGFAYEPQAHGHFCGCGSCSPAKVLPLVGNVNSPLERIERSYSNTDLRKLRSQLAQHFSIMDVAEFEKLFDEVLREMMEGAGSVQIDGAPWNELYHDSYVEGGRKAYEDTKRIIHTAGQSTAEWFRLNVPGVIPINSSSRFVQLTYREGFNLISAKITRYFKGEAMQTLTEGIAAGQDWMSIARALHRRVGLGAGWHWRRLIRTEMVGTFDRASRERYGQMRVKYVRFSLVPGACEVCQAIRDTNGGYFRLSSAPALPSATHPNCRCRWLPVFNLPRGVKIPV